MVEGSVVLRSIIVLTLTLTSSLSLHLPSDYYYSPQSITMKGLKRKYPCVIYGAARKETMGPLRWVVENEEDGKKREGSIVTTLFDHLSNFQVIVYDVLYR